jgi:anti-anti-sigma factor
MQYSLHFGPDARCIDLMGRFTFADSHIFRQIMKVLRTNDSRSKVIVNVVGLSFMDCTALRLMMMICDGAKRVHCVLAISGASGQVLEKLNEAARYNSLCLAA